MDDLIARLSVAPRLRSHLRIVWYLIQLLLILVYADPEIQPFVYVRF